jgi:hypothetical protein
MDPFRRQCICELLLVLVVVFWLWYILLIEERWDIHFKYGGMSGLNLRNSGSQGGRSAITGCGPRIRSQ